MQIERTNSDKHPLLRVLQKEGIARLSCLWLVGETGRQTLIVQMQSVLLVTLKGKLCMDVDMCVYTVVLGWMGVWTDE